MCSISHAQQMVEHERGLERERGRAILILSGVELEAHATQRIYEVKKGSQPQLFNKKVKNNP